MLQPGQVVQTTRESYIKLILDHMRCNRNIAADMLSTSLRTMHNRIVKQRGEPKVAAPALSWRASKAPS